MLLQYAYLSRHPRVFQAMTGLRVGEFDDLVDDVLPAYGQAEVARLSQPTTGRPQRQRAIGAGHAFTLAVRDQLLLTVIWLRQYPTQDVLGYLFGVSAPTVSRTCARWLPVLEAAGQATMDQALAAVGDPARRLRRRRRRQLDDLLRETPELAVVLDTFEQRVQRPQGYKEDGSRVADDFYSGKKKQHTLKTQVAVDEETGRLVDLPESVPGPTADLTVLKDSGVLGRLPPGVGGLGDKAFIGGDKLVPGVAVATPRRKPRGQPRPPEDVAYNTAFARRRIIVEHRIGRLRRFQCLSQTDRHHRHAHTSRARAAAGLVNRQLRRRFPY
jgi:DDE superfamily endonuclease/Helix-turn-helix of DDE superfamily endonuclease